MRHAHAECVCFVCDICASSFLQGFLKSLLELYNESMAGDDEGEDEDDDEEESSGTCEQSISVVGASSAPHLHARRRCEQLLREDAEGYARCSGQSTQRMGAR